MGLIELQKGLFTAVDNEDDDPLKNYKFTLSSLGYVAGHKKEPQNEEEKKNKYLARLIMGFPAKLQVHHINQNPLDNRRKNLKVVNRKEHGILHRGCVPLAGLTLEQWSQVLIDEYASLAL